MKTISFVFTAALVLTAVGCKKKGTDCAQAIGHSMDLAKADMQKTPGMNDKMLETLRDIGVQRCKADKWSDDVLKCMSDAKTEAGAQACYGKLSPEQQENMNKAAMAAAGIGGGADGAGSGSAGAGSAMGSDTGSAGSAAAGDVGSGSAGSAAAGSGDVGSGSAGSTAAPK